MPHSKKVEFKDVGETFSDGPAVTSEQSKHYPSMTISSDKFPELLQKKVKDTCNLLVIAKVTGMRESDDFEAGDSLKVNLDIKKMALSEEEY